MIRKLIPLIVFALSLTACDSGNIEEKTITVSSSGKTVKLTAVISGVQTWGGGKTIALAGFSDRSNYAVVQRAIPATTADHSEVEVVLSSLGRGVRTVELVLSTPLRERLVTLAGIDLTDYEGHGPKDTIRLSLDTLDVSLYGCLQRGIFDRACIQCHGATGRAAGRLDLMEGRSLTALVNVASTQKEGHIRVKAGDPAGSLLHLILNEGGENLLHYNHTEVLSSQFRNNLEQVRELIDEWIGGLE